MTPHNSKAAASHRTPEVLIAWVLQPLLHWQG